MGDVPVQLPNLTARRDGRQSDTAFDLWRGAARLLRSHGFACLAEVTLRNGRRADLMGLGPKSAISIVEVKSSVADFRADDKWHEYRDFCDAFYFCVGSDFPLELLPEDEGLIVADRYGAAILKPPIHSPLSTASRKALVVSFADVAARRLHDLIDPEAAVPTAVAG